MKINSTISSLGVQRQLSRSSRAIAHALERLSTGRRLNRAADDSAGLAIATRIQAQKTSTQRAILNATEGSHLLAVADGALSQQIEIVHRMRELALQSASGGLSAADRGRLNEELLSLREEINRVAESINYNNLGLIDGSFGTKAIQVGPEKENHINLSLSSSRADDIFDEGIESSTVEGLMTFSLTNSVSAAGLSNLYFVDLNGDGHKDIFTTAIGPGSEESVLLSNGDGTFAAVVTQAMLRTNYATFADFNNDGDMDIFTTESTTDTGQVFLGNGSGSFSFSFTFVGTSIGAGLAAGDFNGDGNSDIAYKHTNEVIVRFGDGNGSFGASSTLGPTHSSLGNIVAGDFDQDGRTDLAATSDGTPHVNIFFSDGGGAFTFMQFSNEANGFTARDFNNDGYLDLIGTYPIGADRYDVSLGNGGRSFTALPSVAATNIDDGATLVDDFDNDGNIDMIVNSSTNSALQLYQGLGTGYFSAATSIGSFLTGVIRASGDVNGDGIVDIIRSTGTTIDIFTQDTLTTVESTEIDFSIATQQDAQDLLQVLDGGLDSLLAQRAAIGAQQNRLASTTDSLLASQEALSGSLSQLVDADFAQEASELMRAQFLQQAGSAVLVQANQSLQVVLSLLRSL